MKLNDCKILLVAHGHPTLSKGGAEIAAENLKKFYTEYGIQTQLLARVDANILPESVKDEGPYICSSDGSNSIYKFQNDFLLESYIDDWFEMSNRSPASLRETLSALLSEMQPDVIHIHHYAHIGLELLEICKEVQPQAKVIFTLHEYMAICLHNGQMVKSPDNELCYESSAESCANCFPQYSEDRFIERKKTFLKAFENVDQFTSPSHFLKSRYVDWGIVEQKMSVIENVHKPAQIQKPRKMGPEQKRNQFAYFGQATPYKGLDLILDAFSVITEEEVPGAHLHLFAGNIHFHANEFQDLIYEKINALAGRVTMHGCYEPEDMPALMRDIDWVVVPSIWWENSPMVIQEAIRFGRPLIGSDIGGVAEKVKTSFGLHFKSRDVGSLKQTLVQAASNDTWERCRNNLELEIGCEGQEYVQLIDAVNL
jgi:glycosyltransferase involved in cell wall biosynthesis